MGEDRSVRDLSFGLSKRLGRSGLSRFSGWDGLAQRRRTGSMPLFAGTAPVVAWRLCACGSFVGSVVCTELGRTAFCLVGCR